jgi:hypothetical protein
MTVMTSRIEWTGGLGDRGEMITGRRDTGIIAKVGGVKALFIFGRVVG